MRFVAGQKVANSATKRHGGWWNDTVDKVIKEKRSAWKAWQKGGSKELYLLAKKAAKRAVYQAKQDSQLEHFEDINNDRNKIYKLAKRLKRDSSDIIGEKCIHDDNGKLALSTSCLAIPL